MHFLILYSMNLFDMFSHVTGSHNAATGGLTCAGGWRWAAGSLHKLVPRDSTNLEYDHRNNGTNTEPGRRTYLLDLLIFFLDDKLLCLVASQSKRLSELASPLLARHVKYELKCLTNRPYLL